MKTTIHRLLSPQFQTALGKLAGLTTISAKQRYGLAKLIRQVRQEAEDFEAARVALVKRFGTQRHDGVWEVSENGGARPEFNAAIADLARHEVELFAPTGIDVPDSCDLSAAEMDAVFELLADQNAKPDNIVCLPAAPGPAAGV